jgi:Zn-dependent peptidase ImmA (M78 family)/transcriptional regulator with XRE-family HTH domain
MVISGERVKQARELKGMTQSALAKAVGVTQAAIAQVESGAFLASEELIAEIAKRTGQPVRFFVQEPAPEFPLGSLLLRSHKSMTKKELAVTYRNAQLAYEAYLRLRGRLKTLPVKIPKIAGDPVDAARKTRKALGLSHSDPIPHLLNVLEWHGLLALVVPHIGSSEAFSLWFQDTPIMSLSADRSGDRARMTVSHELGHLVMHAGKSRFDVDDSEADDFAGEFLLPEDALRKEIRTPVTLSSLAALKPRWRVSIQALIYRAKEIGTITDRQYRYLFEQLSSMGWRKQEPIEIAPEQPRAFRQMVEMLYGDPIDYRSAAHDLAFESDRLRSMIGYYAPKGERAAALPANVVSLSRVR